MKEKTVKISIIFLLAVNLLLCGFIAKKPTVKFVLNIENNKKTFSYEIPFLSNAKRKLLYKGSFYRFYEKEYLGYPTTFLDSLNTNILPDIDRLCEEESVLPIEPKVVFSEDGFSFVEGKNGKKINRENLLFSLPKILDGEEIVVEKEEVIPTKTLESLKKNTAPIAEFFTDYSSSAEGRKKNIALAGKKINLSIVPAKGFFSFNSTVGARTKQNGFFEAKIISDGEYTDGFGGGVCQVSTTLYNAWLLAGKNIFSSSAHSLPASYVRPSFDAMVSENTDLVLYNDSSYPAYIKCVSDGKKISVAVFGEPQRYTIKLRSEVVGTIPAEIKEVNQEIDWQEGETERIIKKPKDGLVSVGYRDFYENGKLVFTETLRKNYYLPIKGEIVKRDTNFLQQ